MWFSDYYYYLSVFCFILFYFSDTFCLQVLKELKHTSRRGKKKKENKEKNSIQCFPAFLFFFAWISFLRVKHKINGLLNTKSNWEFLKNPLDYTWRIAFFPHAYRPYNELCTYQLICKNKFYSRKSSYS